MVENSPIHRHMHFQARVLLDLPYLLLPLLFHGQLSRRIRLFVVFLSLGHLGSHVGLHLGGILYSFCAKDAHQVGYPELKRK
jgi:hypothetical protein